MKTHVTLGVALVLTAAACSGDPTGSAGGELTITPATGDTLRAPLGGSSAPMLFTITNNGVVTSGALQLSLGGAGAADFVLMTNRCSDPTELAQNASCTIRVVMAPTGVAGERSATVNVTASPGGTASSAVIGVAANPALLIIGALQPDTLQGVAGLVGSNATITISNVGASPSGPIAFSLSGTDMSSFSLFSGSCSITVPVSLAVGASCTIRLDFDPVTTGIKNATLTASASPGGSPTLALVGFSYAPPVLSVTADTLNFGNVTGGSMGGPLNVILSNTGPVAATQPAISITGPDAASFSLGVTTCVGELVSLGSCTIPVMFAPAASASGTKRASVTMVSTLGGSAVKNLVGVAVP